MLVVLVLTKATWNLQTVACCLETEQTTVASSVFAPPGPSFPFLQSLGKFWDIRNTQSLWWPRPRVDALPCPHSVGQRRSQYSQHPGSHHRLHHWMIGVTKSHCKDDEAKDCGGLRSLLQGIIVSIRCFLQIGNHKHRAVWCLTLGHTTKANQTPWLQSLSSEALSWMLSGFSKWEKA